jgi:hypothetical protein
VQNNGGKSAFLRKFFLTNRYPSVIMVTYLRETQNTRRTKKMTIANKIAMELAINNLPANTPCPAWLMWMLIGLVGALVVGAVVAIIAVNK